jgi:hypothetical protein
MNTIQLDRLFKERARCHFAYESWTDFIQNRDFFAAVSGPWKVMGGVEKEGHVETVIEN